MKCTYDQFEIFACMGLKLAWKGGLHIDVETPEFEFGMALRGLGSVFFFYFEI